MADLHDRLLPLGHGSNDQGLAAIKGRSTCVLAGGQSEAQKGSQVQKKFILALIFSFTFMIVEVIGGYFANSLAIMTDAAHLLSDVGGFGVSIFAAYYASKRSQQTHTFGYHRVEVLAALASVLCSWAVTGVLVAEAVHRIINPTPVNGKLMFFLSLTGIAVNILNLVILGGHHHHGVGGHDHSHDHSSHGDSHSHGHSHSSHDHSHGGHDHSHGSHGHDHDEANINLRGAVIHVLGDFVQSIGVAVAGALIWWKQDNLSWQLADPICTFVFALLVLLTTRAILGDIWDILMERVPRKMDIDKMEKDMLAVDGVAEVHDLHVWGIKPGMPILAAHVTTQSGKDGNAVLGRVTSYCRSVGIDHSTIQISDQDVACPCNTYPDSSNVGQNQQDASQTHDHNDQGHDHNHSHQHDHGHNGSRAETVKGHSHAAHSHDKHDHKHSHDSNDMV